MQSQYDNISHFSGGQVKLKHEERDEHHAANNQTTKNGVSL